MLKIGVLGAGHLGKIHIRLLKESTHYELVGFYDTMKENAARVEEELGVKAWQDVDALMDAVDVVDVVTPTTHHFTCVMKAIEKGKHVFVEKPIDFTMEQAEMMIKALEEKGLKGQVGHVERFNPAFTAVKEHIKSPAFIEAHRLSQFNPRGTDVPVVLDLMIHDIDAILSIVKSPVRSIEASGAKVISETPDIASARIEFENGCVANLTTSRISMKTMRKTRIFQRDAYITVDFLKKEAEVLRMHDAPQDPDPYALIPRPETEELVCKAIGFAQAAALQPQSATPLRVLDICTGSGCIAWSMAAAAPQAEVYACDISQQALETAKGQQIHCADGTPAKVKFLECDILSQQAQQKIAQACGEGEFNLIISNPPYVCECEKSQMRENVLNHEPHLALFVPDNDPLKFYRAIAQLSGRILAPGGALMFEINERFGAETAQMMQQMGYTSCQVLQDLFGKDRMVVGVVSREPRGME